MKCPIYSAKFISGDPKWVPVCSNFKKSFVLGGKIKSATLYISALGIFEAFINGKRVGEDYMTPGWTNYKKRVQYFEYDIKELLEGENEIVIGLGNGWYSSRGINNRHPRPMYNPCPAMICAISLTYENGEVEIILTDESWLVGRSGVTFSSIYDGETFDGGTRVEYNDNAKLYEYPIDNLIPLEGEPTREIEELRVKEVITTPKGETVLDFGQNLTGVMEFVIKNAVGGETVKIECAEILDKDGNFYNDNYRSAKSCVTYTTKKGWRPIQLVRWQHSL